MRLEDGGCDDGAQEMMNVGGYQKKKKDTSFVVGGNQSN